MSHVLTLERLQAHNACKSQEMRFLKFFGEKVVVTEEICVTHAKSFAWDWAAGHLLSAHFTKEFDVADFAAEKAYDRGLDEARMKFEKSPRAEEDYTAQYAEMKALERAYKETQARLFAKLFNLSEFFRLSTPETTLERWKRKLGLGARTATHSIRAPRQVNA